MNTLQELSLKTLIHNLAENNSFNTELEQTSKTSLKGRSVNLKEFNQALSNMTEIHSIFKDQSFIDDLCKISKNLESNVYKINNPDGQEAYNNISKLVHQAALYLWNHSNDSMESVIKDFPITDEKSLDNSIDENRQLFLYGDLLGVNRQFINDREEKEIRETIQNELNKHPSISKVQVQGSPPIPRKNMEELLKDDKVNIKDVLSPLICSWDGPPSREIILDPHLAQSSGFFLTRREFLRMGAGKENKLTHLDFSPETVELLNKHANDLESIEVNESNVEELSRAANFFMISSLLKKCDEVLLIFARDDFSDLTNNFSVEKAGALGNKFIESLQDLEGIDLPQLKIFYTQTLQNQLLMGRDVEGTIKYIEEMKEKNITLIHLSLPFNSMWEDSELARVLELCPSLESLEIHSSKLTDAIGSSISKLPRLKNLVIYECTRLTDEFLPQITKNTQLEKLTINGCKQLTDNSIVPFIEQFTELQELNIFNNKFTDKIGPSIAKLPNIEKLDVTMNNISDAFGPSIENLNKLKKLTIASCDKLTDAFGPSLAKLEQLQELDISYNDFTDAIGPFLNQLSQLKNLSIINCKAMTNDFKLSLKRPNLRLFR